MKQIFKTVKNIEPIKVEIQLIRDLLSTALTDFYNEFQKYSEEWDQFKQPAIILKIDEHNKKVTEGGYSYLYNELGLINPLAKLTELRTEFIESKLKIRSWDTNKLSIKYRNGHLVEFELFKDVSSINEINNLTFDLENIKSIKIDLITLYPSQDIRVDLSNDYSFSKPNYIISSDNEARYRFLKDKYNEIFGKYEIKNLKLIYRDYIKQIITVISGVIFFFLFNQLIYNLRSVENFSFINGIPDSYLLWIILIPSLLVSYFMNRELASNFPYISYDDLYGKSKLKFIISGLVSPLIFDLIRQFLINNRS